MNKTSLWLQDILENPEKIIINNKITEDSIKKLLGVIDES